MWKKPRSSNLSYVEEVLLVDLCLKYRDVIENKRTDAVNARAKEDGGEDWPMSFGPLLVMA